MLNGRLIYITYLAAERNLLQPAVLQLMEQSSAETVGLYIAFDWINLGKKLIDMMSVDQVEWEMYKYNIGLCELVLGISHYLITSSLFHLFIIFSSL